MKMYKEDFKAIAEILKEGEISLNQNNCTFSMFIEKLADYFEKSNPIYDKQKFLKACGVEK